MSMFSKTADDFSWLNVTRACTATLRKVVASLVLVALTICVCAVVKWVHERGPELLANHITAVVRDHPETMMPRKTRQLHGSDTGMRAKEKSHPIPSIPVHGVDGY